MIERVIIWCIFILNRRGSWLKNESDLGSMNRWSSNEKIGSFPCAGHSCHYGRCVQIWEAWLLRYPLDLLALRGCHDAYLSLGDGDSALSSIARVLPVWHTGLFGYGQVLAMHAMALCEAGQAAVRMEPTIRNCIDWEERESGYCVVDLLQSLSFVEVAIFFAQNDKIFCLQWLLFIISGCKPPDYHVVLRTFLKPQSDGRRSGRNRFEQRQTRRVGHARPGARARYG